MRALKVACTFTKSSTVLSKTVKIILKNHKNIYDTTMVDLEVTYKVNAR